MNDAAKTILIEGKEKEIRDQYYVFLALAICFGLGCVFFIVDSSSLVRSLFYFVLSLTYLAFARYYRRNQAKQQEILMRIFRFYCIHTAVEVFYGIWPELMSDEDAKKEISRTDKGLVLLLIVTFIKYGYLSLRIGLAIHFFRVLRLMRKVQQMKEGIF